MRNGVSTSCQHFCITLTVNIDSFGLQAPELYAYTSMSNCLDVQSIDDSKDYAATLVSM